MPRRVDTWRPGPSGPGRSRAATAPAARWPNVSWPTGSTCSTCRPKLSARARLFDTGHNRKTDAHDAHAVAVVAVRTAGLRVLSHDDPLQALRMLADRRAELAQQRVQTINRLHRLLSELTPGRSKKGPDRLAGQGKPGLGAIRELAGKTRRRLAAELLTEQVAVEKKIKASTKDLTAMVAASGSGLMDLPGVG
jgi:transposase